MPFGNRMGPRGLGPMTGRGAGYCAGYDVPGYMNPGLGMGLGPCAGGWGRGYRYWYRATGLPFWARFGAPAPLTREQQAAILEAQATYLKERLQAIESQLGALKEEKGKEE